VRAGELWWEGKTEALEYKLDKMAPACLIGPIKSVFSRPAVHAQGGREGGGYRVSHIRLIEDTIVYFNYWKVCMETSIAAVESAERAHEAIDKLKQTVDEFRASVKNDISSMKAASERVQNEVNQMKEKYKQAQAILTTPEFLQAIANAERMATALEAIQKLTDTKVSVAVFSGGKTAGEK
jgi:hypothetical protein